MGEQGADLVYTVRDVEAGLWGAAQPLMEDADVERAHSPAFADDGMLYLAYQKVETTFVTRTFEISPTQTFTVTNLPQPGNSQVAFLTYSVGQDLTFDSLNITPTNPAAGENITLTAILRNAGALAVANPVVRFYDGGDGIITRTLPLTLAAGYTATVSVNWTVPVPATAHIRRAVADPDDLVAETDETNNAIDLQTTLPDLTFATLYTAYNGDAITATARLANTGVVAASAPFSVTFRAADPVTGTLLGRVMVEEVLAVGESITVALALTDTATLAGLGDTLWAVADEDGRVVEADEDNNTAYARLPLLPDLTLTAVDIQGYDPVSVTVHNRGPVAAPVSVLQVWSDGLTGTLAYSATLGALTAGASQTLTFTTTLSAIELWAVIDLDQTIAESDEGNNLAVRLAEAPSVPTYTLTIHIEGQGSVIQDPLGTVILPLQSSYFSGTHVTLGASPALGWAFAHWMGDLESTENPVEITMDADKVITATFTVAHKVYLPVVLRNAP